MTTFNEQVEAGARAMYLEARNGAYAGLEFDEIPAEHQDAWRHDFAVGYQAALRDAAAQVPQYRIRYLPRGADGDKGIWYTGTPYGYEYGDLEEALSNLREYRGATIRAKVERRYVTEWTEVDL